MSSPASDAPTGTVTFLFTDIEGSTRLVQRLGEGFNDLIEDHNRLLSAAFGEGYVVRTEGDAFFVAFRSAPAAVAAAVGAQRAVQGHDWPEDVAVKVRMGLHTGDGVIAGGDYAGLDVHRAARIAAAGHGGQILVSDATRALVEGSLDDGVTLRDVGEHRLKDLPRPERLFQVTIAGLPGDFPPPRSLDARPNNLPATLTPFIGRERVLAEVKDLCAANRLVTLTGPGGTGKTRLGLELAMEVLERFPDGAFFVYLAPIVDPALVPGTIAGALDLKEERDRPVLETVKDHLCDKQLLLLLDNFEQVVEAAPVIPELMGGAPGLHCIVTSREGLRVDGEQEYPVPPMTLPDAAHLPPLEHLAEYESVALFLQRARAVKPAFALTQENAPAVAEICTRLDGLPLAIELAAARIRLLTPERILERLEPALPLLSGGGRDRPARQQTLRGAIGWSYDLLDETERSLFRRLAVFMGGCTLEAAEHVCGDGELDVLEVLGSLIDKSLLRQLERDDEPRFLMLQVIREYARERLEETEEAGEILRRHAEYYLGFVRDAAPKLMSSEQPMWLDRLEQEHDNLRAALGWAIGTGQAEMALALAATMWRFWQMRGHLAEARERLREVLAMPDAASHPSERAAALEAAGGIAYWSGDLAGAGELYGECLQLRRELGEPRDIAEAAYNLACIYVYGRDELRSRQDAEVLLDEALGIFRREDDPTGVAKVLWAAGGNLFTDNDAQGAIGPFRESLALYRQVGDRFGEAWALHMLALAEALSGELDAALEHIGAALDLFLAADDRSAISIILNDYAIVATLRDDAERALRLAGAARELEARTGFGIASNAADVVDLMERMWQLVPREEAEGYWEEGRNMSAEDALAYARKEEG